MYLKGELKGILEVQGSVSGLGRAAAGTEKVLAGSAAGKRAAFPEPLEMSPCLTVKRGDRHGHPVLPSSAVPKSGDQLKTLRLTDRVF